MPLKGKKHSEETKNKISKAHKGMRLSEETKRKVGIANKGKKHSEETKKKMGESRKGEKNSMFGKHHSDETKKKISKANKGKKRSQETKEKIKKTRQGIIGWGSWNKGRKHTIETKRKISEKCKGRHWKLSEITKRKMSEAGKGRKHTIEHKTKQAFLMSGEKNPNWKGGITSENLKIRTRIDFRLWREAVFARDNFTCQKTGVKGGTLHAHHIKNFSQFPELRFAIDNGITLSKKAHQEFHKKYDKKNNTNEQLEEFLTPLKRFLK